MAICRRYFHFTRLVSKNPYYFYDLAVKQPHGRPAASFDPGVRDDAHLTAEERALRVFGSLGDREKSRQQAEIKARKIAGISIPGKPEEPTNCCMSGCINCVWELYKDELQDWRHKRNLAKHALMESTHLSDPWPEDFGPEPEGRKQGQSVKVEDEDEWGDVDIGIRVFVETEKRLREKKKMKKLNQLA